MAFIMGPHMRAVASDLCILATAVVTLHALLSFACYSTISHQL